MEAWARIELAYSSFAENRLTTWPPGRVRRDLPSLKIQQIGFHYFTILSTTRRYGDEPFLPHQSPHPKRE